MATKAYQRVASSSRDSPKAAEVGEIDTRAPFESVKAAVTLFGKGASPKEKSSIKASKPSVDRAVDKESQLHLAEKELQKLKETIKNAESTKSQACHDLENAKRTLQELSSKLQAVNESKNSAMEETEVAKRHAKQLEEAQIQKPLVAAQTSSSSIQEEQDRYRSLSDEAAALKQKLRNLQQDFDSLLEAKLVAFQQAADAQHHFKKNRERAGELEKDIASMQESITHLNCTIVEAEEQHKQILIEGNVLQQSHTTAMQIAEEKLESLRNALNAASIKGLENKLIDTNGEIAILQQKMQASVAADLAAANIVKEELGKAKSTLQEINAKEASVQSLENSMKLDLGRLKETHLILKEKETETSSRTTSLHADIRKTKTELETSVAEEKQAREASDVMILKLENLSIESVSAREEAETAKRTVEVLLKETETFESSVKRVEEKLVIAMREAEEAKAAERMALDRVRMHASPDTNDGIKITLSTHKFETLTHKAEESNDLAEKKVVAAISMIKEIKFNEDKACKRTEEILREMEATRAATVEALKQADMAEAAKQMVENELKKWREEENKRNHAHGSLVIDIPEAA